MAPLNAQRATLMIQACTRAYLARSRARKAIRKHLSRTRVANELLQTELSYLNSLKNLKKYFKDELKDQKALFGDLEALIALSDEISSSVEAKLVNWTCHSSIGNAFDGKWRDFKKIYSGYVNTFDARMDEWNKLLEKNKKVAAFCKTQTESISDLRGLGIADLLIMPVQRVPRYCLLVRELIKYTPEEHEDTPLLLKADQQLRELAEFINESKKKHDTTKMVSSLHTSVSGLDLALKEKKKISDEDDKDDFLREGEVDVYAVEGLPKFRPSKKKSKSKKKKKKKHGKKKHEDISGKDEEKKKKKKVEDKDTKEKHKGKLRDSHHKKKEKDDDSSDGSDDSEEEGGVSDTVHVHPPSKSYKEMEDKATTVKAILFSQSILVLEKISGIRSLKSKFFSGYKYNNPTFISLDIDYVFMVCMVPESPGCLRIVRPDGYTTHYIFFDMTNAKGNTCSEAVLWLNDIRKSILEQQQRS